MISLFSMSFVVGSIFALGCLIAVASKKFDDGLVGRFLLSVVAINALGYAQSGDLRPFFTAYVVLILFGLWHAFRTVWRMSDAKLD